jgi:pre-mRNA-splicing factor ATP-dependent RNA helicase DHX38/PRP16
VSALPWHGRQIQQDQAAWEENRLLTSGVAMRGEVATDFDDEEDQRIRLNVHVTKPPFVDGRVTFSKQLSTVPVVKEPTSDMAILSRKGAWHI